MLLHEIEEILLFFSLVDFECNTNGCKTRVQVVCGREGISILCFVNKFERTGRIVKLFWMTWFEFKTK